MLTTSGTRGTAPRQTEIDDPLEKVGAPFALLRAETSIGWSITRHVLRFKSVDRFLFGLVLLVAWVCDFQGEVREQ